MDWLASVLLRRLNAVPLPVGEAGPDLGHDWVRALETDLLKRGWLLSPELRYAFAALPDPDRTQWSEWLLAEADHSVGADRDHTPLFRSFPDVPDSLDSLFVDLLLSQLLQQPQAPCVLCGSADAVRPLNPCGHLVCGTCMPESRFSGCPVCGRRTSSGEASFLEPDAESAEREPGSFIPIRWTRLDLLRDPAAAASRLRDELTGRPRPLSEEEANDLSVLVLATAPGSLDWLPDHVPARENLARAIAVALLTARPDAASALAPQLSDRWGTVTDIARTVWTYSGGQPDLTLPERRDPGIWSEHRPWWEPVVPDETPRVRALPRWLRRAVLSRIDELHLPTAAEDMARHETVWKRIGERLHPFENPDAHPRAAVCFAALRRTRARADSPLGRAMSRAASQHPDRVELLEYEGGLLGVRVRSHASLVEQALAHGDPRAAIDLLSSRPGDLWRRLDELARAVDEDPDLRASLIAAAGEAATRVSAGVLATASNHLGLRSETMKADEVKPGEAWVERMASEVEPGAGRTRRSAARVRQMMRTRRRNRPTAPQPGTPRRVFFPSGDTVRTWTRAEHRDPLDAEFARGLQWAGLHELVERARRLPPYDTVIVDARLADVPAPTRTQASSAQLAGWTRGSRIRMPEHNGTLRLFLHWTDSDLTRVDLDLSCTLLDAEWNQVGFCDYTQLRWGDAVKHSGDLTSAPPPQGATEYIDMDLGRLAEHGVRWLVPVVFSYNDVPFERLDDAFAGFMLPQPGASAFQPDRVVQRFELRGRSRVLLPMVVDLEGQELLWTDANLSADGYGHSVARNQSALARLAADLWERFDGRRFSILDLVAVHALGRARSLRLVHEDGTHSHIDLGLPPEQVWDNIREALRTRLPGEGDAQPAGRVLVALLDHRDLPRLLPGIPEDQATILTVVGSRSHPLDLNDLLGELEPPLYGDESEDFTPDKAE